MTANRRLEVKWLSEEASRQQTGKRIIQSWYRMVERNLQLEKPHNNRKTAHFLNRRNRRRAMKRKTKKSTTVRKQLARMEKRSNPYSSVLHSMWSLSNCDAVSACFREPAPFRLPVSGSAYPITHAKAIQRNLLFQLVSDCFADVV